MDEQDRIRMLEQLWGVIHRARCLIGTTEDVIVDIIHHRLDGSDAMWRRAVAAQKLLDVAMVEIKECLGREEEKPC